MDFTLTLYQQLLEALQKQNYQFLTVEEYFNHSVPQSLSRLVILMRHDVDRKPENALRMAKLEAESGIIHVMRYQ
jgi:hypothetical protein